MPTKKISVTLEVTGRDRYELLDESVDDLVDNYGRKLSVPER